MPEVRNKPNSQSRSSSQGRTSSHICTQIPDPRFPVGLEDQAPMSRRAVAVIRPALFIISPSVPYPPVWHRASCPLPGPYMNNGQHRPAIPHNCLKLWLFQPIDVMKFFKVV